MPVLLGNFDLIFPRTMFVESVWVPFPTGLMVLLSFHIDISVKDAMRNKH